MNAKRTKTISTRVDECMASDLANLARQQDRKVSDLVFLTIREKLYGPMASVGNEYFVDVVDGSKRDSH